MRLRTWITCFAAALCLSFLLYAKQSPAPPPRAADVHAAPETAPAQPVSMLFPELSSGHITALSIRTPERSFHFHLDHQGTVRVNGGQADHEIFSTLLDQIRELPVEHHSAFAPSAQDLILTLVISTGAQQQTARFYGGHSEGAKTRIVLDSEDAPQYRQTNGWRVGTLVMTCEGTRLLDASDHQTRSK